MTQQFGEINMQMLALSVVLLICIGMASAVDAPGGRDLTLHETIEWFGIAFMILNVLVSAWAFLEIIPGRDAGIAQLFAPVTSTLATVGAAAQFGNIFITAGAAVGIVGVQVAAGYGNTIDPTSHANQFNGILRRASQAISGSHFEYAGVASESARIVPMWRAVLLFVSLPVAETIERLQNAGMFPSFTWLY